jgi:PAS domain S-box-containing protein
MTKKPTYKELEQRVKELEKKNVRRTRQEKAIREREDKYRGLFENVSDAVMIFDAETWMFEDANEATLDLFGYSKKEFLALSVEGISAEKEKTRLSVPKIINGKPGSKRIPLRYLRRKDGTIFPGEISAGTFVSGGRKKVIGAVRDITERKRIEEMLKESQARLHYLLTANPAVIYTCEAAGDYAATFVSDNIKIQLGYEPQELVNNPKFWADHVHPEDRPRVFADLPRVFEHGYYTHEYRFQKKDGTYRWMHDELRLVRDGQGNPMEIVGYWIDITERKRMEEALKRAHWELELRVEERTAELVQSKKQLEEINTALRVLLKQREGDKAELEEKVLSNVKDLVLPYVERLKKTSLGNNQLSFVDILESNLKEIISPFSRKLSSKYLGLTPTEIRVADLIKDGKTTKEIAEFMNVSDKTVQTHRDSIRKKIGIKHKKVNLRTYLSSLQ